MSRLCDCNKNNNIIIKKDISLSPHDAISEFFLTKIGRRNNLNVFGSNKSMGLNILTSNLVRMTHFWNNPHPVRSKSKDWKAK
jgi:hypothetical protein